MIILEHAFYNYNYESLQKFICQTGGFAMRRIWRKVALVSVSCLLAVAAWIGLLHLADNISAIRSYRASDPIVQQAASHVEE